MPPARPATAGSTPPSAALTTIETGQLAAYERTIESGLQTFVKVGAALSAIRDGRLYRASHGTFEEYCRERWGMSRSYAHRMIESSAVVEMLPIGNKPATESQARPLAKLPAEEQAPPCPATGGVFF